MCNASNSVWLQIIFFSCIKETVPFSFLRSLLHENGRSLRFPRIFIKKKQTQWLNDKIIIELSYCKISWFVSVSQINYFASTFGFGKKLICLPQTNHDILLNLIQKLLIILSSIPIGSTGSGTSASPRKLSSPAPPSKSLSSSSSSLSPP